MWEVFYSIFLTLCRKLYNNNQNIKKTKLGGEAMDLKHLVSGTDIRGIVSEVEGKKVTLTEKEV